MFRVIFNWSRIKNLIWHLIKNNILELIRKKREKKKSDIKQIKELNNKIIE